MVSLRLRYWTVSRECGTDWDWAYTDCHIGGVLYTIGGAADPSNLWFATPTCMIFSGFLVLKRRCLTLPTQNCHTCRHVGIQVIFLYLSIAETPVNEPFLPHQLFLKSSTHSQDCITDHGRFPSRSERGPASIPCPSPDLCLSLPKLQLGPYPSP